MPVRTLIFPEKSRFAVSTAARTPSGIVPAVKDHGRLPLQNFKARVPLRGPNARMQRIRANRYPFSFEHAHGFADQRDIARLIKSDQTAFKVYAVAVIYA